MSAILDFLTGEGPDGAGRNIGEVLAFGQDELERRHDYIQWLFPLDEPSAAVPGSPVLTRSDIAAVTASPAAQANLARGVDLMLAFYDLSAHWLTGSDHNHLRITRIIKSLRRLASDQAADAFRSRILARVQTTGAPINARTRRFWEQA